MQLVILNVRLVSQTHVARLSVNKLYVSKYFMGYIVHLVCRRLTLFSLIFYVVWKHGAGAHEFWVKLHFLIEMDE